MWNSSKLGKTRSKGNESKSWNVKNFLYEAAKKIHCNDPMSHEQFILAFWKTCKSTISRQTHLKLAKLISGPIPCPRSWPHWKRFHTTDKTMRSWILSAALTFVLFDQPANALRSSSWGTPGSSAGPGRRGWSGFRRWFQAFKMKKNGNAKLWLRVTWVTDALEAWQWYQNNTIHRAGGGGGSIPFLVS